MSQPYPWLDHYPKGIDWDVHIPPKPLYTILDEAAQKYPNKIAIDFMGRQYSYSKLADMVNRLAKGLQTIGVQKETRVGIFMPNSPQYIMAYYAILKAGGTVVNFNPLYSEREVRHQIEDSQVEIMFTLNLRILYPKLKSFIGNGLRKVVVGYFQEALPPMKAAFFTVAKAKDLYLPPKNEYHVTFNELMVNDPIRDDELMPILPGEHMAVLQYTGGTTGIPKGAILTHRNLYVNCVQSTMWMQGLEPGKETVLAVIPFFHVFSMTVAMNLAIYNGFRIIPHPRFDMKMILNDIQTKKPTLFPGVSTLYATINHSPTLDKYDLTSIKMCISGGGPLPVEVKQKFEELTGCRLVEGYGLTEASPVTHCNPLLDGGVTGSIGLPLPGTIVEIIDKEDHTTPMAVGEIGEICIRGPQVMKGYFNQPEETAKVLRNGRLHTGDLGYLDARGYCFVVDRLKEMIIVGGYNVYPRNVEEVLYAHESVAECAVVGLKHESRGEMIKAYVVVKEGHQITEDEMKAFLRPRMSRYAVPHEIEFRPSLPKSAVGKILKKELVAEETKKQQ
jgi:long-chain acyl-CoA synthetase